MCVPRMCEKIMIRSLYFEKKRSRKKKRDYVKRLYNDSLTQDLSNLIIQCQNMNRSFMNHNFIHRIKKYEVKETLKSMKSRRIAGLVLLLRYTDT